MGIPAKGKGLIEIGESAVVPAEFMKNNADVVAGFCDAFGVIHVASEQEGFAAIVKGFVILVKEHV
jgi:hypothetical protein